MCLQLYPRCINASTPNPAPKGPGTAQGEKTGRQGDRACGIAHRKAGGWLECWVNDAALGGPSPHKPGPRPPRCPASHEHHPPALRLAQESWKVLLSSSASPPFEWSEGSVERGPRCGVHVQCPAGRAETRSSQLARSALHTCSICMCATLGSFCRCGMSLQAPVIQGARLYCMDWRVSGCSACFQAATMEEGGSARVW